MKTVNLNKESPSVEELLAMARKKSVLLVSNDGTTYLLEEADDFDREVAVLGDSDRFMRFLKKRSKEKGVISIEDFAEKLTEKTHRGEGASRSLSSQKALASARLIVQVFRCLEKMIAEWIANLYAHERTVQ